LFSFYFSSPTSKFFKNKVTQLRQILVQQNTHNKHGQFSQKFDDHKMQTRDARTRIRGLILGTVRGVRGLLQAAGIELL
jgi:hypothetical protein